jgi:O-methyltransferase involved in polyketide biosynthesis
LVRLSAIDFILRIKVRCAVVFDYVYQAVLYGIQKQSEISNMRRYRFMTGEGLTFGIPEETVGRFLQGHGFKQAKDVTCEELKAAYFTGKNANRKWWFTSAAASTRASNRWTTAL